MDTSGPFTLKNLPYGVITSKDNDTKRCATALGTYAIDLSVLYLDGVFEGVLPVEQFNVFANASLNAFAALPQTTRAAVRARLAAHLGSDAATPSAPAWLPLTEVENHFPMDTYNFSDFYCSLEHTRNCTAVFRADLPIAANWFTAPMVYSGRTSSLVVSGTPVHRPHGIFAGQADADAAPHLQPERHMDFELEMGVFLSRPLPRGQRLDVAHSKEHIFGYVLLNDWSARDIQVFEMPPLGPFHAKGSATSVSPWIVPAEALEAVACSRHEPQVGSVLPHLKYPEENKETYDVELSATLIRDGVSYVLCESNLKELYWTPFQQLTHLASAGQGLTVGDVFGTGTISSSRCNAQGEKTGLGCLFERKLAANRLSSLPDSLAETFLLDGDRIVLEGWCRDPTTGDKIFGFGTCEGEIVRPT